MTSSTSPSSAPPLKSLDPLPGLEHGLLVHTADKLRASNHPVAAMDAVRDLLDLDGVGVVYTVQRGRERNSAASGCIDQTRRRSPHATILLDADCYSGKHRKPATQGLDETWIPRQFRDGLPWAMTDSGYIAAGDRRGLSRLLRAGHDAHAGAQRRGRGVLTALPLASRWLTHDAGWLRGQITATGVPIALMLEGETDPLGLEAAVDGLVLLCQAPVPVAVLRCDMSALGALAHGASAVAVGDYATRRHFYPADGNGWTPSTAAFVPELMSYHRLKKIAEAITRNASNSVWSCHCRVCGGRQLSWLRTQECEDAAAFEHSVSALATLGRRLFEHERSQSGWQRRWHDEVQVTHANYSEIPGRDWRPPAALEQWLSRALPSEQRPTHA